MLKAEKKVKRPTKMTKCELARTILNSAESIREGSLTIIIQDNCVIQINKNKKINLL